MPDLDLAAANVMTDAAVAFARQNGWRIAIAIVDEGGNVVRITRMDECNFLAPDIARGKAVGAAAWKVACVELNKPADYCGARSDEDEAVARAGLRASAFTEKQGG
jgi:uncharacterized protein GlcG (DUF336 family)